MKSSEAIGSSGNDTAFVVEAFDRGVGELATSLEPVENEGFMFSESTGDFLHRLDAGAKGGMGPIVEEVLDPCGMAVAPELHEVFLEDVSADRGQVTAQELVERVTAFPAN